MGFCWEQRGCDDEMRVRCPHAIAGDPCPADCLFAECRRETHAPVQDVLLLLDPERNFDAALKETCRMCAFFLKNGPATTDEDRGQRREGNPNRFLL